MRGVCVELVFLISMNSRGCCGARQQVVGDQDVWDHFFKVGESEGMGIYQNSIPNRKNDFIWCIGRFGWKNGRFIFIYLGHMTMYVSFVFAANFYFAVIVYILYCRFSQVGELVVYSPAHIVGAIYTTIIIDYTQLWTHVSFFVLMFGL